MSFGTIDYGEVGESERAKMALTSQAHQSVSVNNATLRVGTIPPMLSSVSHSESLWLEALMPGTW